MNTIIWNKFRTSALLPLILALLVIILATGVALAGPGFAPVRAPQTATLPAETCSYDGTSNTRTCELWATTGTLALPGGASVPIWGYTATDPASGGAAQLPGPTIIANQGEFIEVILHNNLAETTALIFPGPVMIPDLTGVSLGGSTTYSFTASSPGTYLYEAGPLPNAQHQVAMGLFGALIVRPDPSDYPNHAYADGLTTFDDEALLVLSEVDPALNNSANPAAFDMRDYKPRYWLINGKAYRDTDEIPSAAGNQVLLRYINAGIEQHTMGTLGVDQQVLAVDGSPLAYSFRVATATIGSGQTSDRMVTMPDPAPAGGVKYALYDSSMLLHNNGAAGFGGMLTFITVTDGTPPTTGPTTSAVALAPNPTDGKVDVTLSATISGAANITGAEYFVDATGSDGTGCPMTGAFGSTSVSVNVTIPTSGATAPCVDSATLLGGDHTFYVHGSDGTWGAFNFAVLHLDKLGPSTSGITLVPNPSDGSAAVAISATGNDSATGNSDIVAAEFFIDSTGADGTGTPLTVNVSAPIVSLDGSIDSATMAGLAEEAHTVYVHSMDDFDWWGDYATAELVVDQTGPTTGNVVVNPNPNNGALPYGPTVYAVRVDATIADTSSNIQRVEGYIDSDPGLGSCFPLTPRDGLYNEMVEDAYVYIPLATINALAEGTHQISIRGQDASGNWGLEFDGDLIIDKTRPTVSNVTTNYIDGAVTFNLTADATDLGTGGSDIARAEWFEGADPGSGNGTPMQAFDGAFDSPTEGLTAEVNASGLSAGSHTFYIRARDAAGNWSPSASVVVDVVPPDAIFAHSFQTGDTSAWNGGAVGPVSVAAVAQMDGDGFGMAVTMAGADTPGYVTDLTPALESSYHARFYFNPNSALTGQNQAYSILVGQNAAGTTIFRVQFRRQNQAGGTWQVRASALSRGAFVNTDWFTIANNAPHWIEIAWWSGNSASFSMYIDNATAVQTLTGLNTSAYLLESVLLGPSDGLTGAASGTLYFDAFVSRRDTVIGP